jgi:TonB family protein
MWVRASRRPLSVLSLLGCSSGILLGLSVTVAARDPTPLPASPKSAPAATVADWRLQMVDRIEQAKAFPASGYCKEGLVKVSFRIDRAGNLLASEVAESSQVPAFDAEALAMLERAHPFPPPPEGVAGAFVSLSVPIRFRQAPQEADDEKLRYLNLKADLTLTLDGAPVEGKGLDRAINAATADKNARIIICSDNNVPPEQLSNLAEQVKAAGVKFTVSPRPNPKAD